jgi:hypothetical protein
LTEIPSNYEVRESSRALEDPVLYLGRLIGSISLTS